MESSTQKDGGAIKNSIMRKLIHLLEKRMEKSKKIQKVILIDL